MVNNVENETKQAHYFLINLHTNQKQTLLQ